MIGKTNRDYNLVNLDTFLGCLFVCLYPINAKTAEPIRPKFVLRPHNIQRKVRIKLSHKHFDFHKFYKKDEKKNKFREILCSCFEVRRENAHR